MRLCPKCAGDTAKLRAKLAITKARAIEAEAEAKLKAALNDPLGYWESRAIAAESRAEAAVRERDKANERIAFLEAELLGVKERPVLQVIQDNLGETSFVLEG